MEHTANLVRLVQHKRSQLGQAQVLVAILFLFLIPTTIIVAQNATDNISGQITAAISPENATYTSHPPETPDIPPSNPSNEPGTNKTTISNKPTHNVTPPINQTSPILQLNNTNVTLSGENTTSHDNDTIAGLPNVTPPGVPGNQTIQQPSNETSGNQTQEPPEQEPPEPALEVTLQLPERANRNEPFLISAEIANTGDTDVLNAEVEWVLPERFSILEGSGSHYCDIPSYAACLSELTVFASLSSMLGEQEIKVLVRYNE